MDVNKLNEEIENFLADDKEQETMEAYKAATEDASDWAWQWCDIESLYRYAEAAGKPFPLGEEETIEILKKNGAPISEVNDVTVWHMCSPEAVYDDMVREGL